MTFCHFISRYDCRYTRCPFYRPENGECLYIGNKKQSGGRVFVEKKKPGALKVKPGKKVKHA